MSECVSLIFHSTYFVVYIFLNLSPLSLSLSFISLQKLAATTKDLEDDAARKVLEVSTLQGELEASQNGLCWCHA